MKRWTVPQWKERRNVEINLGAEGQFHSEVTNQLITYSLSIYIMFSAPVSWDVLNSWSSCIRTASPERKAIPVWIGFVYVKEDIGNYFPTHLLSTSCGEFLEGTCSPVPQSSTLFFSFVLKQATLPCLSLCSKKSALLVISLKSLNFFLPSFIHGISPYDRKTFILWPNIFDFMLQFHI